MERDSPVTMYCIRNRSPEVDPSKFRRMCHRLHDILEYFVYTGLSAVLAMLLLVVLCVCWPLSVLADMVLGFPKRQETEITLRTPTHELTQDVVEVNMSARELLAEFRRTLPVGSSEYESESDKSCLSDSEGTPTAQLTPASQKDVSTETADEGVAESEEVFYSPKDPLPVSPKSRKPGIFSNLFSRRKH